MTRILPVFLFWIVGVVALRGQGILKRTRIGMLIDKTTSSDLANYGS